MNINRELCGTNRGSRNIAVGVKGAGGERADAMSRHIRGEKRGRVERQTTGGTFQKQS